MCLRVRHLNFQRGEHFLTRKHGCHVCFLQDTWSREFFDWHAELNNEELEYMLCVLWREAAEANIDDEVVADPPPAHNENMAAATAHAEEDSQETVLYEDHMCYAVPEHTRDTVRRVVAHTN